MLLEVFIGQLFKNENDYTLLSRKRIGINEPGDGVADNSSDIDSSVEEEDEEPSVEEVVVVGNRGIPLSKFESFKKKYKSEEDSFFKKEENINSDYGFIFVVSVIVITVSALIISSMMEMQPCADNYYEQDSFCLDCISPLGAFCNKCNEFNVCAECKKGYYIGNVQIADIDQKSCINCIKKYNNCAACDDQQCLEC